ncbi:MAG: DUF5688 family protein [Eubacteriales bacterium]
MNETKNDITIEEFTEKMKYALQKYYGEEYNIITQKVRKNNDVELHAITILEKGAHISPTIYLEPYYEAYLMDKTFSAVVLEVVELYQKNQVNPEWDFTFFEEYEKVRPHIVYKLINYEKNKTRLEQIPHHKILDLAIICQCLVQHSVQDQGAIVIRNEHLEMWDITFDTVFQDAEKNTEKLCGFEVKNINDVVQELFQEETDETDLNEEQIPNIGVMVHNNLEGNRKVSIENTISKVKDDRDISNVYMYVLTNQKRVNGAATILYKNLLQEIAEQMNRNFILLPSSIHEVIVIPEQDDLEVQNFNDMVREVNETQLEPEEVLADHAYYYSLEKRQLSLLEPVDYGNKGYI